MTAGEKHDYFLWEFNTLSIQSLRSNQQVRSPSNTDQLQVEIWLQLLVHPVGGLEKEHKATEPGWYEVLKASQSSHREELFGCYINQKFMRANVQRPVIVCVTDVLSDKRQSPVPVILCMSHWVILNSLCKLLHKNLNWRSTLLSLSCVFFIRAFAVKKGTSKSILWRQCWSNTQMCHHEQDWLSSFLCQMLHTHIYMYILVNILVNILVCVCVYIYTVYMYIHTVYTHKNINMHL